MKGKVLIVDDDEDLLRLLIASFRAQGFETHGITTGAEALAYLNDGANVRSLGLMILDRMLPDMDGIDILRFFQKKYKTKVPVLILSTLSAEKDVLEGLQTGAIDYVGKPFSVNILLQKARQLIDGS